MAVGRETCWCIEQRWSAHHAAYRGDLESRALLVHHTPAHPRVQCDIDSDQFAQALTNALTNAIDAATEGSDLTIVSTTAADGGWQSRLHNDGPGISSSILSTVFEPLVTNKPGHAGIGLAIAHRVLADHGGSIEIESADGSGTTLTFSLPPARVS